MILNERLALHVQGLKHANVENRIHAAYALGEIGPSARPAVPALAEALRDAEPVVQEWAADALAKIGPGAGAAVPALIDALRGGEETSNPGLPRGQDRPLAAACPS